MMNLPPPGSNAPDAPPPPPSGVERINLPDWVQIELAKVEGGEEYWQLVKVEYKDDTRSSGLHHIYVMYPHDGSAQLYVHNGNEGWSVALDKPANEPAGNFAMYKNNVYRASLQGHGLKSDAVAGLQMPAAHHVVYQLTYKRARSLVVTPTPVPAPITPTPTPTPPAAPPASLEDALLAAAEKSRVLQLNPGAAIQKAIFKRGYVPVGAEFGVEYEGTKIVGQIAEKLGKKGSRVFYCENGNWGVVKELERDSNLENVPWFSQLGARAVYGVGDCGPACLASLLNWRGIAVDVDTVSRATGKPQGFTLTGAIDLMDTSKKLGLPLYWRAGLVVDDLTREIDRGNPCIVLVYYPNLPEKLDLTYQECHWIVIKGYDRESGELIYHDPYYRTAVSGADKRISVKDFEWAWKNVKQKKNQANQAMRVS